MQHAAEQLDFETAAQVRDQIQALGLMQSQQFIDSKQARHNDIDILALAEENDIVCIHWVSIRGGRHVGDKNFFQILATVLPKNSITMERHLLHNTIWVKISRISLSVIFSCPKACVKH